MINNFSQQNLRSNFPTLTMTKVYRRMAFYAFCLYVLSFVMFIANLGVTEIQIDYSDCVDHRNKRKCENVSEPEPCICHTRFEIPVKIPEPVYVYYLIDGMYQNHMAYSESRDFVQLRASSEDKLAGDNNQCGEFTYKNNKTGPYAPCGQLLNSMFNDSFSLKYRHPEFQGRDVLVPWSRKNLRSRPKRLSHNPRSDECDLTEMPLKCSFRNGSRLPNWRRDIWNLSSDEDNNGYLNDDLQNWITISASSVVKKLYANVEHPSGSHFGDGLPAGNYVVVIENNYPVRNFSARKKLIISNASWMGGKNYFFSWITLVLAMFSTVATIYAFYLHKHYGKVTKKMNDYLRISERRDRQIRTSYILAHNRGMDCRKNRKLRRRHSV